ncbi:hypothetical protein K5X82_03825 [Halosquirtibacter xylanolyticus]|uniref:Orn/Lys/Arg family decarboxylase n=1 Tax=Halosquirtibacter xylanolyticus TaxID=3374599 RepID=UPI00374964E3|nr:hypothetical protein K5X82_03825 [Prolixibacteraceae bacterium]
MELYNWKILVASLFHEDIFESQRVKELEIAISQKGYDVIKSRAISHVENLCGKFRNIAGVVIDWDISKDPLNKEEQIISLREHFPDLPIFLISETIRSESLPTKLLATLNSYYWLDDDTLSFLSGRITHQVDNYVNKQYPPFFGALVSYVNNYKYAWHTPGHMGGEGFLKSPSGTAFYNFYGENTMRSDLSISVPELGSLLDHSGVVKEAEELAAKTFNSDQTYFILNGTSTVNQVIWRSRVIPGDISLVDRNCHKSLNYAMVITHAKPMYLCPVRNGIGIIGPVPLKEMTSNRISQKREESTLLVEADKDKGIRMSAITNSTYDGLAYNVKKIKETLGPNVEGMHFDEAWYAYARFHPIYDGFYGMTPDQNEEMPPVFTSHSTHKLLNAFSQGSMLHIKNGDNEKIDPVEFNEAYMMHGSTSPNYPMIASLDVSSQMMHNHGEQMSNDNIIDAIILRQEIMKIQRQAHDEKSWFFQTWQRDVWKKQNFESIDPQSLSYDKEFWLLQPGEEWHGFELDDANYVMLDPIKITFLTPGVDINGNFEENGIPASIVTDYLIDKGVVAEKTDTYSFLMLHSYGTTRGKHGELITALLQFQRDYDHNRPLEEVFPELVKKCPNKYESMGLKDLCEALHRFYKEHDFLNQLHRAFETLPKQVMQPSKAYEEVVKKNVEFVYLDEMMNRIPAVMLVPYPPGIPVMMGGEILDNSSKSIHTYLSILELYENSFPGYEKDIHGVERDIKDNKIRYKVICIK